MIVNTNITLGKNNRRVEIPTRRVATAVNFQGDAKREHERMLAFRKRNSQLISDLAAATAALATANEQVQVLSADNDALRAQNAELLERISALKTATPAKSRKKANKTQDTPPAACGSDSPCDAQP